MAKTTKEIYAVVEKYVSKDALTWILKDSLSKTNLETIAHQCRLEYVGSRVSSQSPEILARDVAQEFLKNPKARELMAQYLDAATRDETAWVEKTSAPEILKDLRDPQSPLLAAGRVGKYLWALLADDRKDTVGLVPIFILKVLERVKQFSALLQQLKKGEERSGKAPAGGGTSEAAAAPRRTPEEEAGSQMRRELAQAQDSLDKLGRKNAELEEKLEELQDRYKVTLTEVQALRHEKNVSAQRIRELEQAVEEMKRREEEQGELGRRLHQTERENKILRYENEKKDQEAKRLSSLKEENEKLKRSLAFVEKKVKEDQARLEALREEMAVLRATRRLQTTARKAEKKTAKTLAPRVGLFVDVQNLYYAARERFDAKIDFQKLLHETLQGRTLAKALAYAVKTPEINQGNFTSLLGSLGYEVKFKDLKIRSDGSAKGDWDLGMAIDMISMADKLDVAVLASGDGDFVDLVRMLQSRNIRVEVASFLHNTSGELMDMADFHFVLDEKILLPA